MQTRKHNKSHHFGWLLIPLGALLLSGCVGFGERGKADPQRADELRAPAPEKVAVVPLAGAEQDLPSAELMRTLAALQLAVADYPVAGIARQRWRWRAEEAERLARQGALRQAEQAAAELQAEVEQASQQYFHLQARRYLLQARQFALLGRPQRERLRAVELSYHRQDYRVAYHGGRALVRELWSAWRWVTVRPGDTLSAIAARPDIYDNPALWPLLQQANKGLVRDPRRLVSGWRLGYSVYPRLDEIFAAVQRAEAFRQDGS